MALELSDFSMALSLFGRSFDGTLAATVAELDPDTADDYLGELLEVSMVRTTSTQALF